MLTPQAVENIFIDCLFSEQENRSDALIVNGVTSIFGFNPQKLKLHREKILDLLDELSDDFKEGKGGGMSFLNSCFDKHGKQWTGEHVVMEQLFCLGIGIGAVVESISRELWELMPGKMPYYMIKERS